MSYRVQINLNERAPLKDKVLLHAKFMKHFQKRKMGGAARGSTQWAMEFFSSQNKFTIIWKREPKSAATVNGPVRFNRERYLGMVVIGFSKRDIEIGGQFIVTADWREIEKSIQELQHGVIA